jgi:hypothetical protein
LMGCGSSWLCCCTRVANVRTNVFGSHRLESRAQ